MSKLEHGGFDNQEDFDKWVTERERVLFEKDKFDAIGKGNDYLFQALAHLGNGSHKLSIATTVMSELDEVPEDLKTELKGIQQQLHDFQDKLRNIQQHKKP
ncbi:hypothetical protein ACQKGD_10885 [Peribacillus frigoritolerans]|uniref:hypothetical protein n=1 Tax=Peribacillus frigoritolerans TaxID=450367 RepID=UPI003D021133